MVVVEHSVLPGIPLVESPFFDEEAPGRFHGETLRIASDLHRLGYATFDFPEPNFDALADAIKSDLQGRLDIGAWQSGRLTDLRSQDAWTGSANVKRIATNAFVIDTLSAIYGRRAFPFQTLNFPVGTQQHFHTDSVHFSSVPERFMCGVWVALEDIDANNGPLLYYPGSHRWPIFTNEHIGVPAAPVANAYVHMEKFSATWRALVKTAKAEPLRFFARKGQALIWAANLLHGGDTHVDKTRTRWSQVTHYYFEGCSYYSPLISDPFCGEIFFREPVDIATGRLVRNTISGRDVPTEFIRTTSPVKRPTITSRAFHKLRRTIRATG
jgi:hypothetical protein